MSLRSIKLMFLMLCSALKMYLFQMLMLFCQRKLQLSRNRMRLELKAGANQSNISSNITFLPCWMKCWNSLRNYKIYKVSKKKKKIMLDEIGCSLLQNKIPSNMFQRKSMNFPCWTGLVGCFIQHS